MRRASFVCIFAVACGGGTDANRDGIIDGIHSPDSVSQVAPSTPVGTVSGQVLTTDFKPLDGVNVTVIIGGASDSDTNVFKAVTDNEGVWSVKNVPAAAVAQVTLTKMAYATGRMQITVPGNAGNFPVNNGNGNIGTVLLTHLDGTYRFQVVTAGGRPARQLKALLEVTPAAIRVQDFVPTYGSRRAGRVRRGDPGPRSRRRHARREPGRARRVRAGAQTLRPRQPAARRRRPERRGALRGEVLAGGGPRAPGGRASRPRSATVGELRYHR
jgi:hypothetical protein